MPLGLAAPPGLVPLVWPGPGAEALVITHIFHGAPVDLWPDWAES